MKPTDRYHIIMYMLFSIICMPPALRAEIESNIIIPEEHHIVTLFTEGDGDRMRVSKIKHEQNILFTAGRVNEKTVVMFPYDKTETVEKAKSKGEMPEYRKMKRRGLFHDDGQVCLMPVSLVPGKNTEVQFATSTSRPGFGSMIILGEEYPVRLFTITYKMPAALKDRIDIFERNLPDSVEITRELSPNGKEYQIRLRAKDLPELKFDADAPCVRSIVPHVMLSGLFRNVNELYDLIHEYVKGDDPEEADVIAFARELTAGCSTDMERLYIIQDWVRENIRYVAIEAGDLAFTPDRPSEVLKKRFGDCKGSASLIKAMLQAVGIDGRLVWIGTDDIPEDFTAVPSPGTANHMIAAALLNDSIYYIDGTVGPSPHGYYLPSIQGKQTLIQNGDHPLIHRVPVLPPEESTDSVVISGTLNGSAFVGSVTDDVSGYYKALLANRLRWGDDDFKKQYPSRFISEGRKNFMISDVSIFGLEPSEKNATIKGAVRIDRVLTESGNKIYFNPSLYDMKGDRFDMKNRTQSGMRPNICRIVRELHLQLPEGIAVEKLPEGFGVENRFMDASVSYGVEGDVVKCRFVLVWKQRLIPFEDLTAYNADITKMNKALLQRIQLTNSNI